MGLDELYMHKNHYQQLIVFVLTIRVNKVVDKLMKLSKKNNNNS